MASSKNTNLCNGYSYLQLGDFSPIQNKQQRIIPALKKKKKEKENLNLSYIKQ